MDKRRTILIFTDWYKPGYKAGGPVQSVYNLAVLLSDWMDVKVVTRNTDLNSMEAYPDIEPDKWILLSPNHQVLYLGNKSLNNKIIKQLIKENKDNIIYINGLFSWYFSFLPAIFCTFLSNASVYISVRGMLHKSALSVKPVKKQIFLAFARGFGLYKKPVLIASNEQEKEEIFKSVGKVKVSVAPNLPSSVTNVQENFTFKDSDSKLRLICIGRIAPEKNTNTLLKALTEVRFPVKIVFCGGYNDPEYFSEFSKLLKSLPVNINAEYPGEIPNYRINEFLNSSDVMIMPSLGENFGHAIYESLAMGVPVIIGNNTPWKDLESEQAGIEVDPYNTRQIAEAVLKFEQLTADQYKTWRQGALNRAKKYLEQNDFKAIYSRLFV